MDLITRMDDNRREGEPKFMKATIYALVDPNTHQVRYVGKTTQTTKQRFNFHIGAAKRGADDHQVYEWMRSLLPQQPVLVILQEDVHSVTMGSNGMWNTAEAAETKWKKRFERSQLLCAIPRDSRAYKSLTNPPNVKAMRKYRGSEGI